jgi:hypothetical protein
MPVAVIDDEIAEQQQVPGAWPKGTLVEKSTSDPLDMYQAGDRGHVIGSIQYEGDLIYFVHFLDSPEDAVVLVRGAKLAKIEEPS